MFKKYMKKVLAFSLAAAMAFSGAQIAGVGGADVASAVAGTQMAESAVSIKLEEKTTKTVSGLSSMKDGSNANVAVKVFAKNVAGVGAAIEAGADKDCTDTFDIAWSADNKATTRNLTIGGIVGKAAPGTYVVAVNGAADDSTPAVDPSSSSGTITADKKFELTIGAAPATANLTLGVGEVATLYYEADDNKMIADTDSKMYAFDKATGDVLANYQGIKDLKTNGYTKSVDASTPTAKNYATVELIGATVGGTQAVTVKGYTPGATVLSTLGTVNVTTKDKSDVQGLPETMTVLAGSTTDLIAKYSPKVVTADGTVLSKITTSDNSADQTDVWTGTEVKAKDTASQSLITDTAAAEVATANLVAKAGVQGTAVVTFTAYYGDNAGSAIGAKIASKDVTVTIIDPTVSVKDPDGNLLSKHNDPEKKALDLDLMKDKSKQVTVDAPTGATNVFVSSNTSVAKVSETGLVEAVAKGTTKITVTTTYEGSVFTNIFNVNVAEKPFNKFTVKNAKGETVTDVRGMTYTAWTPTTIPGNINGINLDLMTTQSYTIAATVETAGTITYYATDTNGNQDKAPFTVDKFTGEIKTKANTTGTGIVGIFVPETATTAATTYEVAVSVTDKPFDTITVKADSVKVVVGKTLDLEAKSEAGAELTFQSADISKVTVDTKGILTGKAVAAAVNVTITAKATDKTTLTTKTVTVEIVPLEDNEITITNKDTGDAVGDSIDIKGVTNLTISAKDNPVIDAKSLNPDVVSIKQESGVWVLTPNKAGAAIIQIDAQEVTNKYAATRKYLVVNFGKELAKITADKSVSVAVGKTKQINASASDGSALSYTSNDTSIATVSDSGLVKGVKAGTTVIMISNADGALAATEVKVTKGANPIKVTAKKVTIKAGKSAKISKALTIKSAKGTKTFAKKSGSKNITVNKKSGKISVKKGTKAGTYKIKIAVKAKGNSSYKAKTVTKTVKVTVK